MDIYKALLSRQTIRDFAPREISKRIIEKLIGAGFAAPSNNHMREWHFVLLQDIDKRKELLDKVIKPTGVKGATAIIDRWGLKDPLQRGCYIEAIPKQYSMLFSAPLLILPFFRQPYPLLKPKSLSDLNYFASIWACIENILVAAAAEGIFGVTRIPFSDESKVVKKYLNIPKDYEFPTWIALGYPAEGAKRVKQVEIKLSERIHQNEW
jgi:nitroreductase